MATTSALQGIPLPENSDPVDVVTDLGQIVDAMEDHLVMRFASTGARDLAVTAPEQGMVAYITGDNTFTYYEGSAWRRGNFSRAGLFADRPAAASTPEGTIYYSTDTNDLFVQVASAWALLNGTAAQGDSHLDASAGTWNATEKTLTSLTIDADADSARSVLITGHTTITTTDDSVFVLKIQVNGVDRAQARLCSNRATGGIDNGHVSVAITLPKGSTAAERSVALRYVRTTGTGTATTIANGDGTGLSYIAAPKS